MKKTSTANLSPLTRLDALWACLIGLASLELYILTLAPGLLMDDSAEFQVLAYTLGMTHPTGYPIYLLLAKLLTIIVPVKDIAYRVNLLSAVFGALTLALVYLAGRMLTGWRLAAAAVVLFLGLNGLFWSQAIIAELYTAAAAFVAAEFILLLTWRQNGKWQYLFAAGLLGGLSLGVHSTVALMAPAIIVYLLLTTRRRADWLVAIGGAAIGTVTALSAFLILDAINAPSSYFNAVARPSLSVWGISSTGFDSPFERLSFLYAARQFRTFMFSDSKSIGSTARLYFQGWDWISYALVTLGLVRLFLRRWKETLLVTLTWIGMMVFVLNYTIWDVYVFFIPTFIPLMLIIANGLGAIMDSIAWVLKRFRVGRWLALGVNITSGILIAVLIAPLVPVTAQSIQVGYPVWMVDVGLEGEPYPIRAPNMPRQLAQAIVNNIEDNAIVFTYWGTLYDFYYVAHFEQGRTGIAFHETYPQDGVEQIADSAITYIEANIDQRPIYFTDYPAEMTDRFEIRRIAPDLYQLFRK